MGAGFPEHPDFKFEIPQFPHTIITDREQVAEEVAKIDPDDTLSFDFESTGLDYMTNEPAGISVGDRRHAWYFHGTGVLEQITPWLEDNMYRIDRPWAGHNIKFDMHLLHKLGVRLNMPVDTQVAQWLINENYSLKLKDLARTRLGIQEKLASFSDLQIYTKKLVDKKRKDDVSIWEIPIDILGPYAALDARLTYDLWKLLEVDLKADEQWEHFFAKQMPFTHVLMQMELNGVMVDQDAAQALNDEYGGVVEELYEQWDERTAQLMGDPVNPRSPVQLRELLFDTMNLKSNVTTKTGLLSTNHLVLTRLNRQDSSGLVATLLEIRKYEKLVNTYLTTLLTKTHDGRIHTNYNQTGTVTGRLSSSGTLNLQNIPARGEKGKRMRRLFIAPEGYFLVGIDYSQIELRLLTHFSRDKTLLRAYLLGQDIHQITADRIGIPRYAGKTVNFGCVPLTTQALTKDGWKSYDEIKVGDDVLGYNNATEQLEWNKVKKVAVYDDAPLVRMHHDRGFSVECTPNHRWLSNRRRHLGNGERPYIREFVTPETLTGEHSIILSAVANTETVLDITPEEAAIVGWLLTDGYIKQSTYVGAPSQSHETKVGFVGRILQKKAVGRRHIEALLQNVEHTTYTDKNNTVHYLLSPDYLRDLWNRANLFAGSLEAFVLGLNQQQRAAFLQAAYLAEGTPGTNRISQNVGPVLDALKLAATLQGYYVSQYTEKQPAVSGNYAAKLIMQKPRITGQRMRIEELGDTSVWCIQTELGTWVMRQDDKIMLTGNTIYGQGPNTLANVIEEQGNPRPTKTQAKKWLRQFDLLYPEVPRWKKHEVIKARERGYCNTIAGRRRHVEGLEHFDKYLRARAERQVPNSIIQGSAGDVINQAMLWLSQDILDQYGAKMLLQVHDELVFEVPKKEATALAVHVQERMQAVKDYFNISIPVVAEPTIGPNWTEAKG